MELWSLREAAYLLSSVTPRDEDEFAFDMRREGPVAQLYRALKDATIAKSLLSREADGTYVRRRVSPLDAVSWAKRRGMSLPAVFDSLIAVAGEHSAINVPPKPMQRHPAQEEAILAKLRELQFDSQAVPRAPPGKSSPAKQAVRRALVSYSTDVFNKAWQRLRNDRRIKDA